MGTVFGSPILKNVAKRGAIPIARYIQQKTWPIYAGFPGALRCTTLGTTMAASHKKELREVPD